MTRGTDDGAAVDRWHNSTNRFAKRGVGGRREEPRVDGWTEVLAHPEWASRGVCADDEDTPPLPQITSPRHPSQKLFCKACRRSATPRCCCPLVMPTHAADVRVRGGDENHFTYHRLGRISVYDGFILDERSVTEIGKRWGRGRGRGC